MSGLAALGAENSGVKAWLHFQAWRHGCKLNCGPYAWDLTKDSRVIRIGRRQFSSIGHLAAQFDQLFETLAPAQAGGRGLLDFSRIHMHKYRATGRIFELARWPETDAAINACLARYKPQPDDLVFDLGAGSGLSTYRVSRVAPNVIAFERDANLHAIFERNIKRHALEKVRLAKASTESLAEMISAFGEPSFCRINLDHVPIEFLSMGASAWSDLPIQFSARSGHRSRLKQFSTLLRSQGFEVTIDKTAGVLWARKGSRGT